MQQNYNTHQSAYLPPKDNIAWEINRLVESLIEKGLTGLTSHLWEQNLVDDAIFIDWNKDLS